MFNRKWQEGSKSWYTHSEYYLDISNDDAEGNRILWVNVYDLKLNIKNMHNYPNSDDSLSRWLKHGIGTQAAVD